jgi:hypothetical protein
MAQPAVVPINDSLLIMMEDNNDLLEENSTEVVLPVPT